MEWLPANRRRVIAVGDLIDDILVQPLRQIRLDTDTPAQIRQLPGGSAANFASWLAAELRASANEGCQVEFFGRVAASDIEHHEFELRRHGVFPRLQADVELPTGCIVVLLQGETRTFLTERGANQNLDVDELCETDMSDVALLYLSGYSVTDGLPETATRKLLDHARKAGCVTMCDPGSAGFIYQYGPNKFLDIVGGADFFVPSREEARLLTDETDPLLAAEALANHFGIVLVTLGSGGVAIAGGMQPARLVETIVVETADATGAGDAFAAGFVASLFGQPSISIEDHVQAAARLARKALISAGGRPA
ncbi:MAG: hypothetical protein RL198_410 [Actinomycetota bacterium]